MSSGEVVAEARLAGGVAARETQESGLASSLGASVGSSGTAGLNGAPGFGGLSAGMAAGASAGGSAGWSSEAAVATAAAVSPERRLEALERAMQRFQDATDWVKFFREVLGVDGVVRRMFPSPDQLAAFEQSQEYRSIQQMVAQLRAKGDDIGDDKEPIKVITVRMPKSLHESLRMESFDKRMSMNQLCISKLLQVIEEEMGPN